MNIIDDCTRESLHIEVDFGITGERMSRLLDRIAEFHGYPSEIVMDQAARHQDTYCLRPIAQN